MTARLAVSFFCVILVFGEGVFGQAQGGAEKEAWGKLRGIMVSEDFEDVPFVKVFERLQAKLAESGAVVRIGYEAIIAEQMQENPAAYTKSGITLELREVSMEKALDQVCAAFNVRWEGSGDWVVIRAMTTGIAIEVTDKGGGMRESEKRFPISGKARVW